MARINTKILSFGDVQKSLQEIEKELNLLIKSVNSPAETNIEDSEGKTGDIKIIKNANKSFALKVKSNEGWQRPIFDHDAMINFAANEHIDWTTDQGSTNIHTSNYVAGGTSEFTLTADSGSNQTISNLDTIEIEGGEGIDTVVGPTDKVTISGEDASTSNKGIAIFSSNNFAVSSGTVTIKDEGVALAELAHMATDSFLGRTTGSTGDVEVLSKGDALAILNVDDGAEANVATDLTATANGTSLTINSSDGDNVSLPAATNSAWGIMSDDLVIALEANTAKNTNVTTNLGITGSAAARTITSSDGTDAIIPIGTTSVSGLLSPALFDEIDANTAKTTNATHSGDVTGSGALTIAAGAVTLAKMADIADDRILGRYDEGDAGAPIALTASSTRLLLNVADGAQVNVSGNSGNSAIYDNSGTPTLKTGITQAEMKTAIGGVYTDTTYSVMASGNSYAAGLVAAGSGTHSSQFLRKDGTWVVPTDTDTNTQTTYAPTWVDSSADALLRLTASGAGSGTQDLKVVAGTGISITPSGTDLTIANTISAVTNHVTNNADDTMAGTLTIDKDSTATASGTIYGAHIDFDHTGITASGQTINNKALAVEFLNGSPTHVGTHNNIGIDVSVRSNTTGTSTNYGISTYLDGADTNYGIYQNVVNGGIDYIQVSSADTADYFKMSTAANGATTLATVDGGAAAAHLTLDVDGQLTMNSANIITFQSGAGEDIVFEDEDDDIGNFSASGLTISTISEVGSDTDKFLTTGVGGLVKYVTGANLLSYIGGSSTTGTVTSVGTTGTVNGVTLTGTVTSSGNLTLGGTLAINNGDWSGVDLSVTNGGTGASSLTDNNVLTGTGTSAITAESNLTFDGTDLSIASTGKLILGAGDTSLAETSADVLTLTVGNQGMMLFTENGSAGTIELNNCSNGVIISEDTKLFLDGGSNTYIKSPSADSIIMACGSATMLTLQEDGATNGDYATFGTTAAGFTQDEPTYNATDTYVYFNRTGNKAHLTFGAASTAIVDVHMHFPPVSGNFQLLIKQHSSGGGSVTNWKTFDKAGSNESTVVWAGGSAPTLTTGANKIDIISVYWDADNNKAYGVASLNF